MSQTQFKTRHSRIRKLSFILKSVRGLFKCPLQAVQEDSSKLQRYFWVNFKAGFKRFLHLKGISATTRSKCFNQTLKSGLSLMYKISPQNWLKPASENRAAYSTRRSDRRVTVTHRSVQFAPLRGTATNLLHPHNPHQHLDLCVKEAATQKAKSGSAAHTQEQSFT